VSSSSRVGRTNPLLKMGTLCFLETSGTNYALRQCHIVEERNPQPHRCEKLKVRAFVIYIVALSVDDN
jgi:hypothetical protein